MLTVNRLDFNPPVEMTIHKSKTGGKEHDENGLFEETVDRLKNEQPGFRGRSARGGPSPHAGWLGDGYGSAGRAI